MSWQPYVDRIVSTEHVDKAAILARADGALVAGSPGFAPSADESAGIAKGISSDYSFPDGITFGGAKYAVIRSIPLGDNHSAVLTMKKKESEDEKATGLILTTTNTLVLVAHYDSTERGYTGVVNDALSGLADYLVSSGM
eukprot:CAMPEP_0196778778 /NCGR_PEP_ID=MMETSP1104-20130614/6002_1 /TAXON_ID=33652 /ORGANISM="Cafeteria sp., Strain Caron Lab Isolate" /LENGTH=139 /DNA_ID=CAMNT_0042148951 /DNA_START=15 /DNA_END=434 /DNA_ORIENTATION=-